MIDFHLTINQLELIGAICATALVVFPLFKSALGGMKKQIGRMSLHAKILLGFCIVNSVIVCGTKTDVPSVHIDGARRSISLINFTISQLSNGRDDTPARASLDLLRPCCARLLALLVGQPDRCATGEFRRLLATLVGGYARWPRPC